MCRTLGKSVLSQLLGLLSSMDVLKYYHLIYGGLFLKDRLDTDNKDENI